MRVETGRWCCPPVTSASGAAVSVKSAPGERKERLVQEQQAAQLSAGERLVSSQAAGGVRSRRSETRFGRI